MGFLNSFLGSFGLTAGPNEKDLAKNTFAPYTSPQIQRFLPPQLQSGAVNPLLNSGMAGIAQLLQNPGALSPGVGSAIAPRLAMESQNIAQNYRGIGSNQAGAAARGNVPISIRTALQTALDTNQQRAQQQARQQALTESDAMRREDLANVYKILDTINQFIQTRIGPTMHGAETLANNEQRRGLALMSMLGTVLTPSKPAA